MPHLDSQQVTVVNGHAQQPSDLEQSESGIDNAESSTLQSFERGFSDFAVREKRVCHVASLRIDVVSSDWLVSSPIQTFHQYSQVKDVSQSTITSNLNVFSVCCSFVAALPVFSHLSCLLYLFARLSFPAVSTK